MSVSDEWHKLNFIQGGKCNNFNCTVYHIGLYVYVTCSKHRQQVVYINVVLITNLGLGPYHSLKLLQKFPNVFWIFNAKVPQVASDCIILHLNIV